ncbi:RES domain-containing protein [Caballeronia sp. LZ033]|uniref:RES domain-containing protein n=1 Tax=Caballeronia sp. LZ033 TaxID=3038566 RepID=UPI002860BA90|nr:RES domain-containing protein [Caballeronia sp. LZ033]MDR5812869.1 RES domain-containing protein [Caballeronia sp. LZ033]
MMGETDATTSFLLCSKCFVDEGLRIDSWKIGVEQEGVCPNCKSSGGRKLRKEQVLAIAHSFFVSGTTIRFDYGGAPCVQFNEHHYGNSSIAPSPWLDYDVKIIEEAGKIGFFHYGPRYWMLGEVEPLKALQDPSSRCEVIKRIVSEYPVRMLAKGSLFYRVRVNPQRPAEPDEYDCPPLQFVGRGRLDSTGFGVMYGSQDLDICIHECRVTAEDDIYVATLQPTKDL